MSHSKERKEKKCLNCEADVFGRYCHVCGQENIETNESIWALISHFFEDITHFDGKFFKTIKVLLLKPAFLSAEYLKGKRASYFHPIRMYIFTSFFFFLIYFSFYQKKGTSTELKISQKELEKRKDSISDVLLKEVYSYDIDTSKKNYKYTVKEYDSLLDAGVIKDSWVDQKITRKSLFLKEKYDGKEGQILTDLIEKFFHTFPQVLFITLPLIAFLLKLLYFRRKNFYYVHHAIFTIHVYCAIFFILLISLWINSLLDLIHLDKSIIDGIINFLIFVGSFFYIYKSLRNFYQQSRLKTFIKFILINIFSILIFVFAFIIMFTFTVMTL